MTLKPITRMNLTKPPMVRQTVTVQVGKRQRKYEVLTNRYSTNYPVFVNSASQDGAWILTRNGGVFRCACPGFQWTGACAHVQAALQADTALFAPDPWPRDTEAVEFDRWLDEIGDEPPDDGEQYLSDYERASYG